MISNEKPLRILDSPDSLLLLVEDELIKLKEHIEILDMALALACKDLGLAVGEHKDPKEYIKGAREAYTLKKKLEKERSKNGV